MGQLAGTAASAAVPRTVVPALGTDFVHRRNLVRRLLSSSDVPIVLIAAPAGYGKSTLLAQWAQEDKRAFVWLLLDVQDTDPAVLLERLIADLECLDTGFGPAAKALKNGSPISTVVLPLLSKAITNVQIPLVIAVDDVHILGAPSLEVLSALGRNMPNGSQLALASRVEPDLSIGRFRANRQLVEIGPTELALSLHEAAELLLTVLPELNEPDLSLLMEQTEGWAAGLYLAALAIKASGGSLQAAGFSGRDRVITDYLWDELLKSLPEKTVEFLIRSSIFEQLSGAACDAVLERTGSGTLLSELARSNVFLIPLDSEQETYRYHHLFADVLRAELLRRDPELMAALQMRASSWSETQGKVDAAIHHATKAGAIRRAARLIWRNFYKYQTGGRVVTVERWLEAFTPEQIAEYPLLALTKAWAAVPRGAGDEVARWTVVAQRPYYRGSLPGGPASLASAVHLLNAVLAPSGMARMIQDAQQAYDKDEDPSPYRGVARYMSGVGHHLIGETQEAVTHLEEARHRLESLIPSVHSMCLAQLALLRTEQGDWHAAQTSISQSLAVIEEFNLGSFATMAPSFAVSSLVRAQSGNPERAHTAVRQAAFLLARYSHLLPWIGVQCRLVMSRTHLMLADSDAALTLLSESRFLLRGIPDATVLNDWLEEISNAVTEFPMPLSRRGAALTTAELRILQFLPTHLSFSEIGDRLNVSRNTVKSQAIAVYRKLGVSSRSGAVERAREVSLLEV